MLAWELKRIYRSAAKKTARAFNGDSARCYSAIVSIVNDPSFFDNFALPLTVLSKTEWEEFLSRLKEQLPDTSEDILAKSAERLYSAIVDSMEGREQWSDRRQQWLTFLQEPLFLRAQQPTEEQEQRRHAEVERYCAQQAAEDQEVKPAMLNLHKAKKNPSLFHRLTGFPLDAFEELMEVLNKAYPSFEKSRLARKERQRAIGAGGKFKLSLAERVFMTLF